MLIKCIGLICCCVIFCSAESATNNLWLEEYKQRQKKEDSLKQGCLERFGFEKTKGSAYGADYIHRSIVVKNQTFTNPSSTSGFTYHENASWILSECKKRSISIEQYRADWLSLFDDFIFYSNGERCKKAIQDFAHANFERVFEIEKTKRTSWKTTGENGYSFAPPVDTIDLKNLDFKRYVDSIYQEYRNYAFKSLLNSESREGTHSVLPSYSSHVEDKRGYGGEITTVENLIDSIYYGLRFDERQFDYLKKGYIASEIHVEELYLCGLKMGRIPREIFSFGKLEELDLQHNRLDSIINKIENLTSLKELLLSNNSLSTFPDEIHNLKELKVLSVNSNSLIALPDSIGNLTKIKTLDLGKNKLVTLPQSIIKLKPRKKLDLSYNRLDEKELPSDVVLWLDKYDSDWRDTQNLNE